MRILVAEDDAATGLLIRRVLEKEGYEVALTADGIEALECYRRRPPDIVITDFLMPRMDGIELCRELKAAEGNRFVPIIMLTGGQDPELLQRCLQAGALEFLRKPVQPEELVARVGAIATLAEMHNALAASQEATLDEIAIVKDLLERMTTPGLRRMPPGFKSQTLQTHRINGDASSYCRGVGGTHFGMLCDATGHGLVAGVSTLPVILTFHAMAALDFPLEVIYREVNAKLCRILTSDRFVCLILLRLDPRTGQLRVLNAGMPEVLILGGRDSQLRSLPAQNLPAGILPNPGAIPVDELTLEPGDRLLASSDGLWDLFGEPVIREAFFRRGARYPVAENHAWIKQAFLRSLKNAEQIDDITWTLWEVPPTPAPTQERTPAQSPAPEEGTLEALVFQFELDPRIHAPRDLAPNILNLLGFKGVPLPVLQRLGLLLVESLDLVAPPAGMARCRLGLRYGGVEPPILRLIEVRVSGDGSGSRDQPIWSAGVDRIQALAPDAVFQAEESALSFSLAFKPGPNDEPHLL